MGIMERLINTENNCELQPIVHHLTMHCKLLEQKENRIANVHNRSGRVRAHMQPLQVLLIVLISTHNPSCCHQAKP